MRLTKQESQLLEYIVINQYGCLEDCERTDEVICEDASVRIQQRRFIEYLREHGHFRQLKFADGLPVLMIVHIAPPRGVNTGTKRIRLDKD